MSAHVLLNLLNELGKRDKMWGLLFLAKKPYIFVIFQEGKVSRPPVPPLDPHMYKLGLAFPGI